MSHLEHPRRLTPYDRLVAAMTGVMACGVRPDAGIAARDASWQAGMVLESLRCHNRLVAREIAASLSGRLDAPRLEAQTQAALSLVRMIPLVSWLRGGDERILNASSALALAPDHDEIWGLGCGAFSLWLRALHVNPDASWARAQAADRYCAMAANDPPPSWAREALFDESAGGKTGHPLLDLLLLTQQCLVRGENCDDAVSLAEAKDIPELLPLVAASAGMIYGQESVLQALGVDANALDPWQNALDAIRSRAVTLYRLHRNADETSETHPLPIEGMVVANGMLGLSPMPGESCSVMGEGSRIRRNLASDLQRIKDWGATDVISLLPADAFIDHDITSMEADVQALGMGFVHLPVTGLASATQWAESEWLSGAQVVAQMLRSGRHPVIHADHVADGPRHLAMAVLLELGAAESTSKVTDDIDALIERIGGSMSAYDLDDLAID